MSDSSAGTQGDGTMLIGLLIMLVLVTCYGLSLAAMSSTRTEVDLVPVRVRVEPKRRA